jgi:hypothetical protein
MKIPPPLIPKEHGAWAVLFVPLLVGASSAGRFTLDVLLLAFGTLAVFMSHVHVQSILRALLIAPQTPDRLRAAKFWAAVYLGLGALFMAPLFLRGLSWLFAIGILSVIAFFVNFVLTRHNAKTVLNLIYHLVVLASVGILAAHNFTPLLAIVAFVPMTVHAIYGTLNLSSRVSFRKLGVLLLAHALIFALLFASGVAEIFAQVEKCETSSPSTSKRIDIVPAAATSRLQARINAAQRGDTIFVPAGIYDGNLVINKKLALIGRDWPVIHGSGTGSVVLITADSCLLKGFVVERSGKMLVDEDAGILINSDDNVVAEFFSEFICWERITTRSSPTTSPAAKSLSWANAAAAFTSGIRSTIVSSAM